MGRGLLERIAVALVWCRVEASVVFPQILHVAPRRRVSALGLWVAHLETRRRGREARDKVVRRRALVAHGREPKLCLVFGKGVVVLRCGTCVYA